MTALVKKIKDGRAYWYATDSARVNGQPRVVRQRYLGTVESIEAAFDAAFEPESIDVVEFGGQRADREPRNGLGGRQTVAVAHQMAPWGRASSRLSAQRPMSSSRASA